MKAYNILNILLLLTSFIAHSQQCPPSGLKIQMPLCDTPGNLRVSPLSCTSATLHWLGNSEQQYIVTLAGKDAADNLLFEEKSAKYACAGGSCSAIITVQEGAKLSWSVQGICTVNGARIYSPVIQGREVVVPRCGLAAPELTKDMLTNWLRVVPNPSTGQIVVQYNSTATAPATIKVYDGTGKAVFVTQVQAVQGNNTYRLNLSTVAAGMYNMELLSGGGVAARTSFAIQR